MWGRALLGRLTGDMPFERPWMADYIDLKMTIDARRTRGSAGSRAPASSCSEGSRS